MMKTKILIIEDDKEINSFVASFLIENDYDVISAYDGLNGIKAAQKEQPDLILLDIMLPYQSGDEVLKSLREENHIPVIIVSAKSLVQTKVDLLRLGADDYITKPFALNELLARIEAVLKRTAASKKTAGQILEFGQLKMDLDKKEVLANGVPVTLTTKEFALLELLLTNPIKVFSKQNLYESVWNETYVYDNDTINTHVSNLRKKLKAASGEEFIQTVWGMGYKLKLPPNFR
ncbi:MAG: response regulator transcription factor [Lachnospiraceae bacterium]